MTHQQVCRKIVLSRIVKWSLLKRISIFTRMFWDRIIACSTRKTSSSSRYGKLSSCQGGSMAMEYLQEAGMEESGGGNIIYQEPTNSYDDTDTSTDSDLVNLKITLLGDSQIGKTSFLKKFVGDEQEKKSLQMKGLNLMDKTLSVKGATIAFRIWDVGAIDHVPIACKDAVAILYMFDLTRRTTLNSVIGWYSKARKWNLTSITILIGTKFDEFVQLPPDIQWTIISQARSYAKAMKETLFFSSATHNINVNKIFKFIMAKLFNLPWTVERNLIVGQPVIDFF